MSNEEAKVKQEKDSQVHPLARLERIERIIRAWRRQRADGGIEVEMPAKWVLDQIARVMDAIPVSEAIGVVAGIRRGYGQEIDKAREGALANVVAVLEERRLRHG